MPMDVEDMARLGRRKEVCPYYAAREALQEAELVLLPYPALLLQAKFSSFRSYGSQVTS
jgi:chromosome transmission fidelity protein 1